MKQTRYESSNRINLRPRRAGYPFASDVVCLSTKSPIARLIRLYACLAFLWLWNLFACWYASSATTMQRECHDTVLFPVSNNISAPMTFLLDLQSRASQSSRTF
jgi:hypothetical protein